MKKYRKFKIIILSFVLSLVMLFNVIGMNTVHAAEMETIPSKIWVNGEDILKDADKTLECGGTAIYEESSNTLTLNAAVIDTVYQSESAGIFANGDLNIVVNEDCSIIEDGLDSSQTTIGIGILATGTLNISGGGSLTINVKDAGVQANNISLRDTKIFVMCQYNSFWANRGMLAISGGDITAISFGNYPALWADTDMTISGGKVKATSNGSNGMGAGRSLFISGNADVMAKGSYPGLFANSGIFISGGKVHSTGTNDSGIFTSGILSISKTADVTAIGDLYCGLQANGAITISGGKVNATSPKDSAIYTPVSITITGSPEILAKGYLRALQTADLDISGGTIIATSTNESAITATEKLSITGEADVIANGNVCALLAENIMILSAKNIEAYSKTNYAVSNVASDIMVGGKLIAKSQNVYAIRSYGNILTDNNADISATGGWGGIQADGNITFNGSKIEAIGNDDDGIYATGIISINGGSVHAKGAFGYAAIRAKAIQKADEEAVSKITLSNLTEKNGSKVAFIDWFVSDIEAKSFTTFIGKDDTALNTSMTNALSEVWLATPYTVTFDVNGGDGNNFNEKVYPNNKVAKPTVPTKNGWVFNGWYNGDIAFDFTNTAITENITLTANWHAHNYETDWKSDALNHWHECSANDGAKKDVTAHTAGDWIIDKAATETEKGSQHRECIVCQYIMETEEIPMVQSHHTHNPSGEWITDTINHWNECSCGKYMNIAAHNYGEWTVIKTATETKKGRKERNCSTCGYKEIADIPTVEKTGSLQTSDNNNGLIWIGFLFMSSGVFIGTVMIGKKKCTVLPCL